MPGELLAWLSVLSHRRGDELQLEVLILKDAVERGAWGATEGPAALSSAVLGEFGQECQPGAPAVEPTELVKGLDLLWVQDWF